MQNKYIALILGILVVLVAAFFAIQYKSNMPTADTATTTDEITSLDELIASGRATITVATSSSGVPKKDPPSLNYTLKVSPDLSPAAQKAVQTQVDTFTASLKKDSNNFDAWMQMGTVAKIAGDYPRAIELWLYASYLIPNAPETYANLGDMYGNFLHDYQKGEMYYKKAVEVSPGNPLWEQYLKDFQQNKPK